jgi:phosphoribosylformylglycinamidine synthase subunit PurS
MAILLDRDVERFARGLRPHLDEARFFQYVEGAVDRGEAHGLALRSQFDVDILGRNRCGTAFETSEDAVLAGSAAGFHAAIAGECRRFFEFTRSVPFALIERGGNCPTMYCHSDRRYSRIKPVAQTYQAQIYVTLRPSVLDPAGTAVQSGLKHMGYDNVDSVRIGKFVEMTLTAADEAAAKVQLDKVCDQLLANPVIENYRFELKAIAAV